MGASSTAAEAERGLERHTLAGLLGLILVSLCFQLAAPDTDWARLVIVVLQGATLLVALRTAGARKALLRIAIVAVLASIVTATLSLVDSVDLGATSARVVTLLLVALAPPVIVGGILRDVRAQGEVTVRTMFGVLSVYLLIGMLFSFCFNLVQALADEPFFSGDVTGEVSDFLYYSFTTLTTTGFGDFTAASGLGRSLSVMEALIGQIYLVTVVAVIVTNIRPRRRLAERAE